MTNVIIREAEPRDLPFIARFMRDFADFEKLTPPDDAAVERLGTHAFEKKYCNLLAIEIGGKLAGYAIYFFTYGSFSAVRTLYVEDVYVSPSERNRGIGEAVMKRLASIATKNDCGRMEWRVLDWNVDAIRFYERLGASLKRDELLCRMNGEAVVRLAGG